MDQENTELERDLLGLVGQWRVDINTCSLTFGTPEYVNAVSRFRNDIVDIRNGPPLKQICDEYWDDILSLEGEDILERWKHLHKQESMIEEEVGDKKEEIRQHLAEKLCNFMIQQIVNKIGFDRLNRGGWNE